MSFAVAIKRNQFKSVSPGVEPQGGENVANSGVFASLEVTIFRRKGTLLLLRFDAPFWKEKELKKTARKKG